MSKAVCCLGIYAVITTIIIAILSWIISADIACSLVTNVTGTDNKIKTSNNYEFLSFDNRRCKDGGEKCSTWEFHGIESFEFLVMGIFAIYMLVKGIRKICGKVGYLERPCFNPGRVLSRPNMTLTSKAKLLVSMVRT